MRSCLLKLNDLGNGLCIGLDPDLSKIPQEYNRYDIKTKVYEFLREIVKLTRNYVSAYKLNKAFFEQFNDLSFLKKMIKTIRELSPGIPIIVDCKIGDTKNTMGVNLKTFFEYLDADAIVVNPYMGDDVLSSFDLFPDRGIVLLIRTSNEGSKIVQDVLVQAEKKQPLWSFLLDIAIRRWNKHRNIIPVLSGHANLEGIRKRIPEDMSVIYAGVGAQEGDIKKIRHLFNSKKGGVIVSSSRALIYPYNTTDKNWREKVLTEVASLVKQIRDIREELA